MQHFKNITNPNKFFDSHIDTSLFDDCYRGKIREGDIDTLVERRSHHLFGEWKEGDREFGGGQRQCLDSFWENDTSKCCIAVRYKREFVDKITIPISNKIPTYIKWINAAF